MRKPDFNDYDAGEDAEQVNYGWGRGGYGPEMGWGFRGGFGPGFGPGRGFRGGFGPGMGRGFRGGFGPGRGSFGPGFGFWGGFGPGMGRGFGPGRGWQGGWGDPRAEQDFRGGWGRGYGHGHRHGGPSLDALIERLEDVQAHLARRQERVTRKLDELRAEKARRAEGNNNAPANQTPAQPQSTPDAPASDVTSL